MQVTVGERWQGLIAQAVESGRYASAEDFVAEAMHVLAARERAFQELKDSITEALADPQVVTEEEIDAALGRKAAELRARGIPG